MPLCHLRSCTSRPSAHRVCCSSQCRPAKTHGARTRRYGTAGESSEARQRLRWSTKHTMPVHAIFLHLLFADFWTSPAKVLHIESPHVGNIVNENRAHVAKWFSGAKLTGSCAFASTRGQRLDAWLMPIEHRKHLSLIELLYYLARWDSAKEAE